MDNILISNYINYINSLSPHIIPCIGVNVQDIRSDVINDIQFEIKDLEQTIQQPIGMGIAIYDNPHSKIMAFIDYESFITLVDPTRDHPLTKGLKKCDFIVYDMENYSVFLLNELSNSSNPSNKRPDAKLQLHSAALHLSRCPETKIFIDQFQEKKCVFSNKIQPISSPHGIADAFNIPMNYLSSSIPLKFQPLTKLGFQAMETSNITL
ncbi:hypothetical protein [Dysgonomonas sp. ZJ709]|uniref:hypothetical protein n=1 Tax=Dysgonomonas sp. ZJ709 TaxID=2709797 RepID=UPI0013EC3515|nr:hypothetical protein [Dysgonomonas sp. ZJ709]